MYKSFIIIFIITFCFLFSATHVSASEYPIILKSKVIKILNESEQVILGTDLKANVQSVEAEVLSEPFRGVLFNIDNDYVRLNKGDVFYASYTKTSDGFEVYSFFEFDRTPVIILFFILFLIILLVFGGVQGLRGLISLALSLLVIIYVLVPQLLGGHSPIIISLLVSSFIIITGSYITHGFNRTTTSAVFGMLVTIFISGTLSWLAVRFGKLTGVANEEAVYLNFNTGGNLDMSGLLLGGMLIGLLGVLYDAAISQAIFVEEMYRSNSNSTAKDVFKRGLRVGREHIGALVDTLAIAYVGASLPLLLLFAGGINEPFSTIINRELFSTEILRTLVGSIGLILSVPITTFIASHFLKNSKFKNLSEENNFGHRH
jgi:uncharacterized membrane protein